MIRSGDLSKLVVFLAPFKETDANGKRIQRYEQRFSDWAHVRPLRGGEAVMQSRLASKGPAIVTIIFSAEGFQITSEWRVDIDGRVYDLKEDPREAQGGAVLEMLVERVG
ncbi:SPP1 family predicted phage head-tail adaptor [Paracoccus pantotrophus]|uniref:Phage head closure protein n=1 Tax=Paracoccus pantotrophus TaxID=82367 RepID=A0AAE6NUF2_PARPN|nr:phage head closure protein [Paracoccus pantotrophus]QFG35317.1 phage head closure protein [Paracoccus pantotrophus]RKS44486.1 SPP1 family predicted phage head-tail adaptor [Paracoccus pantotrophus]